MFVLPDYIISKEAINKNETQIKISSQGSLQFSPKLIRGSHTTSAAGSLNGTDFVKDSVKTKSAGSNLNLNSRNVA